MLERALSWLIWPGLVGGGMVATHFAIARGAPPALVLVSLQLVAVAAVALLERWMPEHASWNVARGDVRTDATHMFVSGMLVSGVLRVGLFAVPLSLGLWPAHWPIAAQLVLALALADLGSYGTHVISHRMSALWPIHAPHHSAERLYWLNSSRMHPLDTATTLLSSLLPLALLGAPAPVLALFDAFAVVHLLLQHSNVRLRQGALNHVFATAEFHRWHHSSARAEGESNYASFFSLWDHLFGTFRMPAGAQPPEKVGLYDGFTMPAPWTEQLLHPFRAWRALLLRERRGEAR